MTVTAEEALKVALDDVAECLERREYYDVSTDQILVGEAAVEKVAGFARSLADTEDLSRWIAWVTKRKSKLVPVPKCGTDRGIE